MTTKSNFGRNLILAILAGLLAGGAVWITLGSRAGVAAGFATAVVGAVLAMLRRNQRDLSDLKGGHVPGPVNEALGGVHRPPD